MPSVRDTLKSMMANRKGGSPSLEQGADQNLPDVPATGTDGVGGDDVGQSQDDLIAQRLKMVADQRAALAQAEIQKQQQQLNQLQEMLKEVTKQGLPPGSLSDDIDQANHRLNEAKADFARASEVRQNTDLTTSLRQESSETTLGTSVGGQSVREKLGGPSGGPKLGGDEGMELRARAPSRRM